MLGSGIGREDFEATVDEVIEEYAISDRPIHECVARAWARYALRRQILRAEMIVAISHRAGSPRSFAQALIGRDLPC